MLENILKNFFKSNRSMQLEHLSDNDINGVKNPKNIFSNNEILNRD